MQIYHVDDRPHKWKPTLGQWCWFYNFPYDYPILAKFTGLHERKWPNGYAYCEPFIGELPSIYKDLYVEN